MLTEWLLEVLRKHSPYQIQACATCKLRSGLHFLCNFCLYYCHIASAVDEMVHDNEPSKIKTQ